MTKPWPVDWLEMVDSTNEEARRRAKAADFAETWIAARRQAAGRGRMGRSWASPVGNLYCTALYREPGGVAAAVKTPFAAAVAVADVAASFAPGAPVQLKWPNDVRVGREKLSGILIETGSVDGVTWVAAGIGVNVASAPEGVSQSATSIAALRGDRAIDAGMALGALREAFARRLEEARTAFPKTREAWLARAEGLGEGVSVSVGESVVNGVFETLDDDGGLVLRLPDGAHRTIRAGDVSLVTEASSNAAGD